MKIAAARALAELAHEPVPDSVAEAYGVRRFRFGPDYIIPKPFDTRVLWWCAPAVAEAAMKSGVGAADARHRRVPRAAAAPHGRHAVHDHEPDRAAREERAQAHRVPRRRQHQGAARLPDRARRGDRASDPARRGEEDPPARRRAGSRPGGRRDAEPGGVAQALGLRARVSGAALPQRRHRRQRRAAHEPPHPLRHDDGQARRRRRPGRGTDRALSRHHPARAADPGHPSRRHGAPPACT